jgi:hypothetical protein
MASITHEGITTPNSTILVGVGDALEVGLAIVDVANIDDVLVAELNIDVLVIVAMVRV